MHKTRSRTEVDLSIHGRPRKAPRHNAESSAGQAQRRHAAKYVFSVFTQKKTDVFVAAAAASRLRLQRVLTQIRESSKEEERVAFNSNVGQNVWKARLKKTIDLFASANKAHVIKQDERRSDYVGELALVKRNAFLDFEKMQSYLTVLGEIPDNIDGETLESTCAGCCQDYRDVIGHIRGNLLSREVFDWNLGGRLALSSPALLPHRF